MIARHKSLPVEAHPFSVETMKNLPKPFLGALCACRNDMGFPVPWHLHIRGGWTPVYEGDLLIRGVDAVVYVVPADVYPRLYEVRL